jgi:hypothetical protein
MLAVLQQQVHPETESTLLAVRLQEPLVQVVQPAVPEVVAQPTAATALLDQVQIPAAVAGAPFTQVLTAAMVDNQQAAQVEVAAGLVSEVQAEVAR